MSEATSPEITLFLAKLTLVRENIDAAMQRVTLAEQELARAKECLIAAAISLSFVKDKNERRRMARELYWKNEVSAWALTIGMLFDDVEYSSLDDIQRKVGNSLQHRFRAMIGPYGSIKCSVHDCNNLYYIPSRTELNKYAEQAANPPPCPGYYCDSCKRCPVKPVPCKDWHIRLAEDELKQQEWLAQRNRRNAERRSELSLLESRLELPPEERARLYELLSWKFQSEWDA